MIYLKKIVIGGLSVFFAYVAFAGEPIRHVRTTEKVVALTFDDGPGDFTQPILDVLNKYHVKGTFYVLGCNVKANPALIHKIIEGGHDLGNHTMYHDKMKNRSVDKMVRDISSVDAILRKLGYEREITFRSPFGITSENLNIALTQLHKRNVLFTFLPQDWTSISSQAIYNNVIKELKPGLIITLHDGGNRRQNTVKATEMLIQTLKEKGYRFVTISELLRMNE